MSILIQTMLELCCLIVQELCLLMFLQTFKFQSFSLAMDQVMMHHPTSTFVCLLVLLSVFSVSAQHLVLE